MGAESGACSAGAPRAEERDARRRRGRGPRGRLTAGDARVARGPSTIRCARVRRPAAVREGPARRRRSLRACVALTALRTGGSSRTRGPDRARGTCRAVGSLRSRGSRRANGTERTGGAGLAILTVPAGGSGRPRTTRRPWWTLGSDDALPWLAAAPRWARHRLMPEPLHLTCESVTRLVSGGQVTRQGNDLDGEPCEKRHREEDRHGGQPLGPRDPTTHAQRAHFATTAQIAIAAARRPMRTGMIIW